MTDTEKDIAAIDIGIKAIERNKAAIEECKRAVGFYGGWLDEGTELDNIRFEGKISAYESILKILEEN